MTFFVRDERGARLLICSPRFVGFGSNGTEKAIKSGCREMPAIIFLGDSRFSSIDDWGGQRNAIIQRDS